MALIDLSQTVADDVVTYPGLPAPVVCDYLSRENSRAHYSPGTEFQIGKIEMVGNTGTYLDSPFHRYADGKDLSELPISSVANLPAVCVRVARSTRSIDRGAFDDVEVKDRAVLLDTGWCRHWNTPRYFRGHPFLTAAAATYLANAGAILVGIDSLNLDDTSDGTRPAHSQLLGAEIPIVEHLTGLEALPDDGFRFTAAPVKVRGFGTFPVRAFAVAE